MRKSELLEQIEILRNKLIRAEKRLSGLREKSKHLEMQYEDARGREENSHELVMELVERQRELNVMLNRANIMLNRTQEVMALTSMEFNEMAKALPEPKKAEWSDRVSRINDLFKKTGIQDAEVLGLESANPQAAESLETDELKREAAEAFSRKEAIWQNTKVQQPPQVEAVLVEESEREQPVETNDGLQVREPVDTSDSDQQEANTEAPPTRRFWWQRRAG